MTPKLSTLERKMSDREDSALDIYSSICIGKRDVSEILYM